MSNREIETQDITPRLFPFDAWEHENPSRDSTPDLILKSPWRLRTESDLEIDGTLQIDGALITNRTLLDEDDLTITDTDGIRFLNVITGASDRTVTWPTAGDNANRMLIVRKADTGAGSVINDGEGSETFDLYSGSELWQLATFELLQAGDWTEFISDGTVWVKCNAPYWHKFDDPATGIKASKTTGWTADQFTPGGLEVTFSEAPLGALAIRDVVNQEIFKSEVFYRKSGDANISNTPAASGERSHLLMRGDDSCLQAVIWLSAVRAAEFAVTDVTTDLVLRYPTEYYQ